MNEPALFDPHIGRPVAPAAEPMSNDLHVQLITIPLPGRLLRVVRVGDELRIADGFEGDDLLRSIASGVVLPLAAVPALVAALEEMAP